MTHPTRYWRKKFNYRWDRIWVTLRHPFFICLLLTNQRMSRGCENTKASITIWCDKGSSIKWTLKKAGFKQWLADRIKRINRWLLFPFVKSTERQRNPQQMIQLRCWSNDYDTFKACLRDSWIMRLPNEREQEGEKGFAFSCFVFSPFALLQSNCV